MRTKNAVLVNVTASALEQDVAEARGGGIMTFTGSQIASALEQNITKV